MENSHAAAVEYSELYSRLDHPHDAKLEATSNKIWLVLVGKHKTCVQCSEAKSTNKNISKL